MTDHSDAPRAMTEMPWIRWLDLDTTIEDGGTLSVALMRPKPEHLNHNGSINAAVAYGVAEVTGAGAAVLGTLDLLHAMYTVVESAAIRYSAPARGGLVAVGTADATASRGARASIESGEPTTLRIDIEMRQPSGAACGTCQLQMALHPYRPAVARTSTRDDRSPMDAEASPAITWLTRQVRFEQLLATWRAADGDLTTRATSRVDD